MTNTLKRNASGYKDETAYQGIMQAPKPCFETIRRARQKLQREFPELSANETVQGFRAENEEAFRDFARG